MKDIIQNLTERFQNRRKAARRYTAFLLAMALVVTLFVNWELRGQGIAATADYQCGLEEHTHTADCYKKVLVCGYTEGEPEDAAATDADSAAAESTQTLQPVVTEQPEEEGGTDEAPVHHHTDACYEEVLVCPLPEHHHTVACYADPTADVETEQDWEAKTSVALTGNWPEDLLNVARTQLGYAQSEKNFQLDKDDGATIRHYTRYGQWYGNPYGEWDVMFLSYCLHYAGVPEEIVPQRAGVLALRSEMQTSDWLRPAEQTTLHSGDIVLYHVEREQQTAQVDPDEGIALYADQPQLTDTSVSEETVGIVESVDADLGTLTVISGDVDGKVAEVNLSTAEVSDVIALTQAYAAQETVPDDTPAEEPAQEDGGFLIRINWIGQAPEERAGQDDMLLGRADNTPDLADHITKATFSKLVDGHWIEIGDDEAIGDDQLIQVKLTYVLKKGTLGTGRETVVYQLPHGLILKNAAEKGSIYDGASHKVGEYTISTSGEVSLTFTDPAVLNGAEFEGLFQFEAQTDFSDIGGDNEIKFSDNFTLKIEKPTPDLAVSKSVLNKGYLDADHNFYLPWCVTASTKKGTFGETIRIGDQLNGNENGSFAGSAAQILGSYVPESIRVEKIAANGTATPVDAADYTLQLTNADTDKFKSLEVTGLPALKAGEKYKLYYTTKITEEELDEKAANGSGPRLYNNAVAGVNGQPDVTLDKVSQMTFNQKRIQKSVSFNQQTGQLDWTITVCAPLQWTSFGGFLDGYKITDVIPSGLNVKGNVKVQPSNGPSTTISAEELANGYTIHDSNSYQYTFTFSTTLPAEGTSETNTAKAENGNRVFQASASYATKANDWTLSKKRIQTVNGVATWNLTASNTAGSSSFTVNDILDGIRPDKTRVPGSHLASAAELQQDIAANLKLTLVSGAVLHYADAETDDSLDIQIRYYSDFAMKQRVEETDTDWNVVAFQIIISKTGDLVRRMDLSGIRTHEDRASVPVGESRTYRNFMSVTGVKGNVSDSETYTHYEAFEKEVSTDGTNYNDSSIVDYDEVKDQQLRYRLTLNTDAAQKDPITVTDVLPQNVNSSGNLANLTVTLDGKNMASGSWSWSVANGVLTVSVKNYNANAASHRIVISYSVRIDTDPRWKDLSIKQVEYTNAASWGDENASTTTTVTREVPVVAKSGEQIKNAEGQPTNRIRYTVYINQAGDTLNQGADMTLEDRLSVISGNSAYGDISTVKLYYCQIEDGEPTVGDPLPTALYQILPSTEESWLRMIIPDHTRLALQYECEIDPGNANAPVLANQVFLNGEQKGGIRNPVDHSSSQATIRMGQLLLNKRDKDTGRMLPDAQFAIEAYDAQTNSWKPWSGSPQTTDDAGKIVLSVTTNGANSLHPDTLYRITETAAPDNYTLDDTPHYVLFMAEGHDFDAAYRTATGTDNEQVVGTDGVVVEKSSVTHDAANATVILDIRNTYNRLTVNKLWLDSSNNRVEPAAPEIEVQLYRYTLDSDQKTPVGAPVTLDQQNGWSYTWTGSEVPTSIEGVPCYYTVEEKTQGSWTVVLRKNGDVQTGEINLCNIVYGGYELPSTGGSGTAGFALLGSALMAVSLLGGAALWRKKRSEH